MKRLVPFLSLMIAASSVAASETAQTGPSALVRLTLDDAIARARGTSSRLASLSALTHAAAEGVRGAEAGKRPELDLSASYVRNSNKRGALFGAGISNFK